MLSYPSFICKEFSMQTCNAKRDASAWSERVSFERRLAKCVSVKWVLQNTFHETQSWTRLYNPLCKRKARWCCFFNKPRLYTQTTKHNFNAQSLSDSAAAHVIKLFFSFFYKTQHFLLCLLFLSFLMFVYFVSHHHHIHTNCLFLSHGHTPKRVGFEAFETLRWSW